MCAEKRTASNLEFKAVGETVAASAVDEETVLLDGDSPWHRQTPGIEKPVSKAVLVGGGVRIRCSDQAPDEDEEHANAPNVATHDAGLAFHAMT